MLEKTPVRPFEAEIDCEPEELLHAECRVTEEEEEGAGGTELARELLVVVEPNTHKAARERLLDDGFQIPLEELAGLGRRELQADQRLPQIYSQISGLADFFINGQGGRYREAFVEYLERVYTGSVSPDSLATLCRRTYPQLDDEYRRHLAR